MSIWATRRKTAYISSIIGFFLIVIGVPLYLSLQKPPTCFDSTLNQGEVGVDCGGPCSLLCAAQTAEVAVLWARVFYVTDGVYNAVAYVENPNLNAIAYNVSYHFKLFDKNNVLVLERKGITSLTNKGITPIFEGTLLTGDRVPVTAFFEFSDRPIWYQKTASPVVSVSSQELLSPYTSPRIDAAVRNLELYDLQNVEIFAAAFDKSNNAIAVSRTIMPVIEKQSTRKAVFTWPRPFEEEVNRIEIIPTIPPQKE